MRPDTQEKAKVLDDQRRLDRLANDLDWAIRRHKRLGKGKTLTVLEESQEMLSLLREVMEFDAKAIHPGKGTKHAKLVRKVCDFVGWNEDDFLPRWVRNNKAKWGL